ncbi:unnamed protein product, partial [Closterium sp. Naga37s-1]
MPHQQQLHPFSSDSPPSLLHPSSPLPWSSLEQISASFQWAGKESFLPKWIHIFSLSPCLQHASFLFLSSFLLLATLSHILILPKPNPEPSPKPDYQPRRAQNGGERPAGTVERGEKRAKERRQGREGGNGERGEERWEGREQETGEVWRAGMLFWPELLFSLAASICWAGLLIWEMFSALSATGHVLVLPHELAYAAGQAVTYALAAVVLLLFQRRRDVTVVGSARVWLFQNSVLMLLLSMPQQQHGHKQLQHPNNQQQHRSSILPRFITSTTSSISSNRMPSVARALLACFWRPLLTTGLLVLLKCAVMYAGPLLLSHFVGVAAGKQWFQGEGVALVAVLLLAKATETAVGHQFNFQTQALGLDIRAALVGALYHKGLRLSSRAKQRHTVGEVVNYMSTDVQRLADLMLQLHNVWVLPLQISIALLILFHVVGASMVAGLAVMVAALLLNLLIAASLRATVASILKAKDRRMKATSEALSSMRVIKLYAWQPFFENQIKSLRAAEAGWLA